MKNVFFSLAFMLIGSFAFANKIENNNFVTSQKVINYEIDGVNYTPLEFEKLDKEFIDNAKECTVTITVTVQTPAGPMTFTRTETFEASWFGCLLAQVGAFLASIWRPSV